ncbi:MAG: hypothetical protein A3I44_04120 [Candidatus Sungbacteria bacterium RIFCSPLOWO2_02_FULL_51_17]|nr:MAG: hypothetical protein A3I44_04120 [Candidatus Sungbacteria bacterium RIFCSPLOWO2_02_FULL_51_17]
MKYRVPMQRVSLHDLTDISGQESRLGVTFGGLRRIRASEEALRCLIRKNRKPIYGVNTGVGDLCDTVIGEGDLWRLQENLIVSHACGSAPFLDENVSRGALFLVINALAKGYSGVSVHTVRTLITFFNNNVSPLMPAQGSLGASGDLIPLAHLGLLLLGKGNAYHRGRVVPAAKILKRLRITPLSLGPKEALSIINGTAVTTAQAALAVSAARDLLLSSCRATAGLFEVTGASRSGLDARIHDVKPHPGQKAVAALLRRYLSGSARPDAKKKKVQDSYVVRCAPQIDGAVMDHIDAAVRVVEVELNSVTDNPLFFSSRGVFQAVSGGNFHAQNVAFAMDSVGIAMAAHSKVIERRIERLLNSALSGLPPFLAPHGGLNSGLMVTQYLAVALVAENAILAHPASIQSVPVSAGQEDFVSMGMTSARKASDIVRNTERALAVEFLAIYQAGEFLMDSKTYGHGAFSASFRDLKKKIRRRVAPVMRDRWMSNDIAYIAGLIRRGDMR